MYSVSATDLKSISLCENDPVKSVLQNVALILGTLQGSVPMYREFGLPRKFQDKPLNAAKALMISEIQTYIPEFEPRVQIMDISFKYDESMPGQLNPVVKVEIVNE